MHVHVSTSSGHLLLEKLPHTSLLLFLNCILSSKRRASAVPSTQAGYKRIARCVGHSSTITGIDWSKDSTKIMSNDQAYEVRGPLSVSVALLLVGLVSVLRDHNCVQHPHFTINFHRRSCTLTRAPASRSRRIRGTQSELVAKCTSERKYVLWPVPERH